MTASYIPKPQKPLHYYKALEKKTSKVSGDYLVTIKKDGWFVCSDYNPQTRRWSPLKSFAQRIIPAMRHIDINEKDIHTSGAVRLIFEATIPGLDFYTANGIFNRKTELALGTELWLHDIVYPARAVKADERWWQVCLLLSANKFQTVPVLGVSSNPDQWMEWYDSAVANGEEGIVLKRMSGIYTPGGRNEDLLKMKAEITRDLLCIRLERTIGKKGEPSLNAILRNSAHVEVTVVIPKDSEQREYENFPGLVIGKVCEVQAMAETPDGKLREPRWKGIRHDKAVWEID